MIVRGGDQGETHDAAGDEGRKGDLKSPADSKPAAELRGDPGGRHRGRRSQRSKEIVVQEYVSTLSGEHHFLGGVIDASDRRASSVAGWRRFRGTRVNVLTRAEGRPQGIGS